MLHETFAVCAKHQTRFEYTSFDVQLIGGIILHQRKISEMRTGEGKTLVCYFALLFKMQLVGRRSWVTTPRLSCKARFGLDGKIHQFLSLTVGCITHEMLDDERKTAYNCDVTYATNNELGFDYLRDNMKYSLADMAQRQGEFWP